MTLDRQRIQSGTFQLFGRGKELVASRYWLFVGMTGLASLIGTAVPLYPLLGAMAYGVFLALRTRERGREVRFEQLFKGFDKLGETLVPSLVYGGLLLFLTLALLVPAILIGAMLNEAGNEEAGVWIIFMGYAVMPFATALVWVPFAFTFQLILDRELSGMAAACESWRAARENFLKVFALSFMSVLLYIAGIGLCCVGWLLALPLMAGAHWAMYREVYPDLGQGVDAEDRARESQIDPEGPPQQDWSS